MKTVSSQVLREIEALPNMAGLLRLRALFMIADDDCRRRKLGWSLLPAEQVITECSQVSNLWKKIVAEVDLAAEQVTYYGQITKSERTS